MPLPWTNQIETSMVEGASTSFTLRFQGATALTSTSTKVYRGAQEVSSDWLTGSDSASGDTMTSKTVTVPTGAAGKNYVVIFSAVVDGVRTEKRVHRLRIWRAPRG